MFLGIREIKELIEGRIKYRKCPCCDIDGIVWFDSTRTSGVLPYPPQIFLKKIWVGKHAIIVMA